MRIGVDFFKGSKMAVINGEKKEKIEKKIKNKIKGRVWFNVNLS